MTIDSVRPVVLRSDVRIDDPLKVVLGFLEAQWRFDPGDASRPASFDESDLRLANRAGARISAAEIAAILERRRVIERALAGIAPHASLAAGQNAVPWTTLTQLFGAFADIRGVGFSKMTKALHPKRPALIPMLDSVVQAYLQDDDPGTQASFGERGWRWYGAINATWTATRRRLRAVRQEIATRGYGLTEVRIFDLLIWSVQAAA